MSKNSKTYFKIKFTYPSSQGDDGRWSDLSFTRRGLTYDQALAHLTDLRKTYQGSASFKMVRVREDDVDV